MPKVKLKCENCGKEFERDRSRPIGKHTFCSRHCRWTWFKGENVPWYKDGTAMDIAKIYRNRKAKHDARKQAIVDYMGGGCSICGYNKCIASLDVHHVNPEDKTRGRNSIAMEHSWEVLKPELDKCILLCANCHRELHYKLTKKGK